MDGSEDEEALQDDATDNCLYHYLEKSKAEKRGRIKSDSIACSKETTLGAKRGEMLMDNACLDLLAGLRMTLVCKED